MELINQLKVEAETEQNKAKLTMTKLVVASERVDSKRKRAKEEQ